MTAAADAKALAREEQGRRRAALIKGKKKLQATLSSHLSAVGSLFQMWDLNGNGVLDQDEFCQAVNALSVREVPQEVAAMLFRDFDKDRSGEISYHEFLRYALRDALAKSSTKVMDMFQSMDKDGRSPRMMALRPYGNMDSEGCLRLRVCHLRTDLSLHLLMCLQSDTASCAC